MEQTKEVSKESLKKLDINGKWQLTYKPKNSQGADFFGGFTLAPYLHPVTQKKVYLKNPDGKMLSWLMISNLITNFNPTANVQDRLKVEWLLNHPEIVIEGYNDLDPRVKAKKNMNSNIKLVALDYVETAEIQEEDYIDKLVGVISLDLGKNALSLEKIQYILSELNLNYLDQREVSRNNTMAQKLYLRSKLKKFVRSSYANAKKVNEVIDNIDAAETTFQIKELLRTSIIKESNGMYKYNGTPIGIGEKGIRETFINHPELKLDMLQSLEKVK